MPSKVFEGRRILYYGLDPRLPNESPPRPPPRRSHLCGTILLPRSKDPRTKNQRAIASQHPRVTSKRSIEILFCYASLFPPMSRSPSSFSRYAPDHSKHTFLGVTKNSSHRSVQKENMKKVSRCSKAHETWRSEREKQRRVLISFHRLTIFHVNSSYDFVHKFTCIYANCQASAIFSSSLINKKLTKTIELYNFKIHGYLNGCSRQFRSRWFNKANPFVRLSIGR